MSGRTRAHTSSRAPRAGQCQRFAVSSVTAQNTALTSSVLGLGCIKIRFRAGAASPGTSFQFVLGTQNASIAMDATGGGATVGWTLMPGQSEDFEISNETIISWACDGNGFVDIVRSDQERAGTR